MALTLLVEQPLSSDLNDEAIISLVSVLLLEQNDEWAVQRARYMALETISQMSDDPLTACLPWHADQSGPRRRARRSML